MLNLTIFSAGSFRHVLNELVTIFKQKNPVEVHLHLAPAGLLRQRLEADEYCDIFISANLQNINILSATKCIYNQQILAFNQLILTTLNTEHYQHRNTLDILFDESLRLATSTPIADPCGDYTWHLFELLEKAYPEPGRLLKQRAMPLVGGENSAVVIPKGEIASKYVLQNNHADMMIGYANYMHKLANENLRFHHFPPEFNIKATYSAAQLSENVITRLFFQFLMSDTAKRIMYQHGFLAE